MANSNLQKKVLTVRGKKGTHRQTYYIKPIEVLGKESPARVVHPRDNVKVSYGLLWAKDANRGVDHALEAIGKVHGVPNNILKIPIHVTGDLGGANGMYTVWPKVLQKIQVSKYSGDPAFTVAHEYGHYLDHHLFGTGDPSLKGLGTHRRSKELKGLMNAIYRSEAAKSLSRKADQHEREQDWTGARRTDYLLMPTELFARAYSQYIATRASSSMLRECHNYRAMWERHGYAAQWTDEDFKPIAREFDRLFEGRRLRRAR